MTENATETEAPALVVPERSALNDIARMVLETVEAQASEYAASQAQIEAATGDRSKAVHDLRETSEDAEVTKVRKWLADLDTKREAAITKIDAYISTNLLPSSDLTPEQVESQREALKALKSDITQGRDYFLSLPAVKSLEGAENLLPVVKGTRRGVAKGTGTGTAKPRVTGVYIDGTLMAHPVKKDGTETGEQKSTFTDAVKFLSDANKVKVQTSDLHAAYFAAAGVEPSDFSSAPDKVELSFRVAETNYSVLVTK